MVDVGGGGALAVVKFGVCAVVEFDVELRLKGISAHVGPPRPPPPPPDTVVPLRRSPRLLAGRGEMASLCVWL